MSNLSDEQMMQELNKRFEGKTNDSVVREPEVDSEPTVVKEETSEPFNIVSFEKTVDNMTESRVSKLIDFYVTKSKLTEIEKEKLDILEDKYDVYQKNSKTIAYMWIGSLFVIIFCSFFAYKLG